MVLDFINVQNFCGHTITGVKMLLFWRLIIVLLHILILKTRYIDSKYPIAYKKLAKRFMLCLNYNGSSRFLFVRAMKMYQFKAKDSETKPYIHRV